ncbi:MAG: hypothetical protein WC150_14375 [Bacteroidia bacterium]
MLLILSIFNFEFGDKYFSETASSDDFLLLLYKAFIASIPALVVFFLGYIFTKIKESRKEQKGYRLIIQNVYAHFIKIEEALPKIIANFNEYIKAKKVDILEESPFPWIILPDLERVSKLPVDKTFEAFKEIKIKSPFDGIKTFRDSFNCASFLTTTFQKIDLIHKELSEERYLLSIEFKALVGEIRTKIADQSRSNPDKTIRDELDKNLIAYLEKIDDDKPLPLVYHKKELIERFIHLCLHLYKTTNDGNIRDILDLLKKATNLLEDVRFKNNEEIEAISSLAENLNYTTEILRKANLSVRTTGII